MHAARSSLEPFVSGGGEARHTFPGSWSLRLPATAEGYALAQIDDYRTRPRARLPWRPPVRMSLRAHASCPDPRGTLGFGFWNDPFALRLGQAGSARRLPASPQAVWFFYGSPPHELRLVPGIAGHGWKAAALRMRPIPWILLAPAMLIGLPLSRLPVLQGLIVGAARRMILAREEPLDLRLDDWHSYAIEWHAERTEFFVDGRRVLRADMQLPGPLGFVAWIDNQYAIFAPEKGVRFGLIPLEVPQSLEIEALEIESMQDPG